MMMGCEPTPVDKQDTERMEIRTSAMRRAVDVCIERKGVPIFSGWDGQLKDCK